MCADHNCVAKNRNPVAERVHRPGVGSFKVCLLAPVGAFTYEDVCRARVRGAVASLVPIDPRRVAVLVEGSNHDGVARDRDRPAEPVLCPRVGGFEIRLLDPVCPVAHEDVGRARVPGVVVRLVPVDAGGAAILQRRTDHHRVARDRNRPAEVLVITKFFSRCRYSGVGGFDVSLLGDEGGVLRA